MPGVSQDAATDRAAAHERRRGFIPSRRSSVSPIGARAPRRQPRASLPMPWRP